MAQRETGPLRSRRDGQECGIKRPSDLAARRRTTAQTQKSPAPSIGSRHQRGEKRLRFRDLGKFRGRRKAPERRREQGMSVYGAARGIIQSCQIWSCAQLKTVRLLLLRDG